MRGAGSGPVGVPGGQIPANPGSVALCLLCRVVGPCRAWCRGAPQHPVLGVHGTALMVLVPALYPPQPCSPPALHPPALALRAPPHVAPAPLANPWAGLDYCCPPALIRSCCRARRAAPALLAPIPSPGAGVPSRDPLAMGRAAQGGTGLVGPCQGFSLGTAPVPPHPLLGALLGRCRSPGSPFWGCHGSNPDQSRARVPGAARPCCGVPRVGSERGVPAVLAAAGPAQGSTVVRCPQPARARLVPAHIHSLAPAQPPLCPLSLPNPADRPVPRRARLCSPRRTP